MSSKTSASIIEEIRGNLGNPDRVTEIADAKITMVWNNALTEFNKLVGVWTMKALPITASATTYNLETLFVTKVIDVKKALASESDFEYTYIRPNLIINLPTEAATINIVIQEPATLTSLSDEEELVVTAYATAMCEQIVARARVRQATPMRSGDLTLGFGRKEELLMNDAKEIKQKFENDCRDIIVTRMM